MEQRKFPKFAERFSQLRGEMSQEEFAKFLDISRPTVGFYENGSRIPDALTLRKIAQKCNVSADYLLDLSDANSSDSDIQSVCKYTGLTEQAIRQVIDLQETEKLLDNNDSVSMAALISMLIEDPCFVPMMEDLQACLDAICRLKEEENHATPLNQEVINQTISDLRQKTKTNFIILPDYEIPNYYRSQVEDFCGQLIFSIIENYRRRIHNGEEVPGVD